MPRPQRSVSVSGAGVCYYQTLGIARTADEQMIKKAYRQLALRWHPDKNPHDKEKAEQKFKEIGEAYEVLSDKNKRMTYDRYGLAGLKNGSATATHYDNDEFFRPEFANFHFRSPFDIFREFFGGRDPFQDFFGRAKDRDFASFPDPFDAFFAGPLNRSPGENVSRYEGGRHGYFMSHFHCDPLDVPAPPRSKGGFSSVIKFSSGEPGQAAAMRKTSTNTMFVDGKKLVTKKTEESGQETVEILEDGKLKSKMVNGVQQAA